MTMRCLLGFHDWRRREHAREVYPPRDELPPPGARATSTAGQFTVTEQFEQCRRCDKTRRGWWEETEPPVPDPEPLPWDESPIVPETPWPRK